MSDTIDFSKFDIRFLVLSILIIAMLFTSILMVSDQYLQTNRYQLFLSTIIVSILILNFSCTLSDRFGRFANGKSSTTCITPDECGGCED